MTRIPIDDDNEKNPLSDAENSGEEIDMGAGVDGPSDTPPRGSAGEMPSNEVLQLQAERDSLYERLLRTAAEFKNAQKRLESDKEQAVQYANSRLIKELLPVIDNFERALAIDPAKADVPTVLKGLQIVHDQLINVLRNQNVQEIAPRPGDPFDPSLHQALMQQPSDQYTEPTVTQLLQKGYLLHDRVIRAAGVAVSKND
jgi:molecular chaperone GrpE